MADWKDVNYALPVVGDEVIVVVEDDTGDTTFYVTTAGWYTGIDNKWVVDNEFCTRVAYWQYFPELRQSKPFTTTVATSANSTMVCSLCGLYGGIKKGDTLYKPYVELNIAGMKTIPDIKYCPACGKKLESVKSWL